MTTATATNYETLTTGEAKLVLDKVIEQISDQTGEILVSVDDVHLIAYALENNLQLRDYLMGLTSDGLSVESVASILLVLVDVINKAELPAYPVETVLASYMYRLGHSDAPVMLAKGLARGYSLAQLLQRVFNARYPVAMFAAMSNELHAKVCDELIRTSELIVNEENR